MMVRTPVQVVNRRIRHHKMQRRRHFLTLTKPNANPQEWDKAEKGVEVQGAIIQELKLIRERIKQEGYRR